MDNSREEADVHDYCLQIAYYNYRLGGAASSRLKQMDRDVEKDQFWSYQDQKEDGADAAFSDCDQMSSAGEKKTIRSKQFEA